MSLSLLLETMSKVLPLTKNHKDYEDVPDGLKWAIIFILPSEVSCYLSLG
jgi:hypothetical protein